jgi:valyl-tRNA synthetase
MTLAKRYHSNEREPALQARWQQEGVYAFDAGHTGPAVTIDTPPPTVSGHLHLGHLYSYSQTDFIARYWRMNGYNVFYPMGFDDNGLPTERLVERSQGVTATQIGRRAFIERCLQAGAEAIGEYRALWQRLGLSVDWRYTYRTISADSRRASQASFLDLHRRGLIYEQQAPAIWCPTCQTAIAQADVDDLERESSIYTLSFTLENGSELPVATTRPELLAACVAIFVNPADARYEHLTGVRATVPLYGQTVPILTDPAADPEKGTGAVMCCTFGDSADVNWWRMHNLPLVEAIDRRGRMSSAAGQFAGLPVTDARAAIVAALHKAGLLRAHSPVTQTLRVHERCDTPVEFVISAQWFVRILEKKDAFLDAGEQISWHPAHMKVRYRQWVENLAWDWCISRQRPFGVPFPVWHCNGCGKPVLAPDEALPVDPRFEEPPFRSCPHCGSSRFTPEEGVMDTWFTSSLSPQIAGRMQTNPELYDLVFPFTIRPQAHEIIRTWAFYTIVKSHYHFGTVPWKNVAISGWGIAAEGAGKISKSRGGGPMSPEEALSRYSADAVRYWAASTGLGKDAVIDERKIQAGSRLVTKLWNVARFSQRFLEGYTPPASPPERLTLADRWLLSRLQRLLASASEHFTAYDYATAKSETEQLFWLMADNYLEMAKQRLYEGGMAGEGARFVLHHALQAILHILAPIMPFVTEAIYQDLWASGGSIHRSAWPVAVSNLVDEQAERGGEVLLDVASAVRRYKSEAGLPLGTELVHLQLSTGDEALQAALHDAHADLASVSRAQTITITRSPPSSGVGLTTILASEVITVAVTLDDQHATGGR